VHLRDVRAFVLDVDGTLIHRGRDGILHVQPGAVELIERIRAGGRPLVLFTNGSHVAPSAFAGELRGAGLPIRDEEFLTPLISVRYHLRVRGLERVLLFGGEAARAYLEETDVRIVDDGKADAVFVAHADAVDFAKLEQAARAVIAGARLLTASYQPAYAGADGPIFSRGAMTAAALAKATEVRPAVVGKPSRAALLAIADRLGTPTKEIVVIGDDVRMDIALGRLGGARTVLVRSGMSGRIDLQSLPERFRPDAAVEGVADLLDRLDS
jgi:NagD protein